MILLLVTFWVNPTLTPAIKRSSECPNAKTKIKIYASTFPTLEAKEIIATNGAEAQGVLTSPKITPTRNIPKNLSFTNFGKILFLSISPINPKE